MSKNKALLSLTAAAAILTHTTMASARASDFRYDPASLGSAQEARQLYAEIEATAEDYCAEYYGGHRLVRYTAERQRCVADVVDEIVSEVDHPLVYEAHDRARR